MGLWRWIRDVIADRGEHAPLPVFLEHGRGGEGYGFRLGVRAGFGGQETARIPVYVRVNESPHPILKEVHWCEVAGRTLEAANVYALKEKVAQLLDSLAPARTLPLAYFRVPEVDYSVPVYEDDGKIVSPVIGGPNLKADDLGGIRRVVCNYLMSAGYVTEPEAVTVGVVRPRDLSLVAPATVFRSLADPSLWLPTVEGVSAEGPVVGVLASATRIAEPERRRFGAGPAAQDAAPAAPDVLSLLRFVRAEMARSPQHRDMDVDAIYCSELRPEIWTVAEARTEDVGRTLVAHLTDDEQTRLELTIRHTGAGDVAAALFDSEISAFLAPDEDALARQVGRYLHQREFLRFADEIEIHSAAPPRAERLEAEEISTFGRDADDVRIAAGNRPEEVT
ncbi:MAG: hypothetical protein ACJ77M_05560 [Thermoleophilaceae bacterium]|jgi:hypothetical protein